MTTTFIVQPATLADMDELIEVYERAFANIYLSSIYFPADRIPDPEKRRWLAERWSGEFAKPEVLHVKVVEKGGDGVEDRIVGFSRWDVPHELSAAKIAERAEKAQKLADGIQSPPSVLPEGGIPELFDEKFKALYEMQDRHVPPGSAYILGLLAVHPDCQGKGIGKLLLKGFFDQADAEGKKIFLGATEAGYPFYLRLGFKVLDIVTIDVSRWGKKEPGVTQWMVREPQPPSSSST